MKTKVLILTIALITPLSVLAQDDVSDIFDDLTEFEPSPTPAAPTLAIPRPETPEPTPLTIQPPALENPVVYTMESGGEPFVPAAKEEVSVIPLNIEETLSRGKEAYADDDWNGSQKLFEAVLYTDAYNKEAIRWLKRIAKKKAGLEIKMSFVQKRFAKNSNPFRFRPSPFKMPTFSRSCSNSPLFAASSTLSEKGPTSSYSAHPAPCCHQSPSPAPTFSGTDLSALETLDIITQISGMKYEIGPNMISLTPVNYEPPQQMVSFEFDVQPSVGSKMVSMTDDGSLTGSSGLIDVRGFFSTIPFPPSSSAQYNPEFNILLVRNVPKHINHVEALLERYNQKALDERSRQVEIETKFIEVAEGALEELGFEWTFGVDQDYVNNDTWAVEGDQKLFTDTLRSGISAFDSSVSTANRATSFNSLANAVADPTGTGLIDEAGSLLIQKIKGDRVNLLIKALERQAGSDLLSAPKVLTKSGETATIHVGEIRRFPREYDVIIERYAQPSLLPLDYEEYQTGVMLEVTPELDPENGTIDLKLTPEITELAGYDEQHVATIWPSFGDEQIDIGTTPTTATTSDALPEFFDFLTARERNRTVSADRLIARQPVFRTRKVETTVTIEDGSTIAMGGLIKEKLETFKDSVPFLGRIPLLGRLFRSEGEKTVKRNLLIFVTANQVDATGYRKSAE